MVGVELNLEVPPGEPLAAVLGPWFAGVLDTAAPLVARLAAQGPLPPDSVRRGGIACGPAGGLWGFTRVVRRPPGKPRNSTRVYSERSRAWFLAQMADPPQDAEIGFTALDDRGMPGVTLHRARFEYGDVLPADWLKLSLVTSPHQRVADDAAMVEHEEATLRFVRSLADVTNPSFGGIGDTGSGLNTVWERSRRIPGFQGIPASRSRLRGHS